MAVVRYFAAAADAAGTAQETIAAESFGALVTILHEQHPALWPHVAPRCSFVVDGVAYTDTTGADVPLEDTTIVDVLPPFVGG